MQPTPQQLGGAGYLLLGFRLLRHPQLRWFVLVPLLLNTLLFIALTVLLVQQFDRFLNYLLGYLPDFLHFLAWLVAIVASLFIVLIYGYSFSTITNLLGAPFYGLLAEKTERLITGSTAFSEPLWQMVPRVIRRELRKIWYFTWRSVVVLLLSLIPIAGPVLALLWALWCMAVQYCDYAADNHQTPFLTLRRQLRSRPALSLGFGGLVTLGTMVPVLNILVVPAAVIGGTALWSQELRE